MSSLQTNADGKSLIFFLIFCLVTAVLFSLNFHSFFPGIIGIFWGVLGILRVIDLIQTDKYSFPQFVNLPSQILFGLGKSREEEKKRVLNRMERPDCLFWFIGSVSLVFWAIYCTMNPAEISVVKTLHLQQKHLVDLPVRSASELYDAATILLMYGVTGTFIFMCLSFSSNTTAVKNILYSLLPIFIVGCVLCFFFLPIANPALFPDVAFLKGGGLGKANIMSFLEPSIMNVSRTDLMARFIETGWVGAYGAYLVFLPAVIMFAGSLLKGKYVLQSIIGLICLLLVAFFDAFWVSLPPLDALGFLGLGIASFCWGLVGYQKPA